MLRIVPLALNLLTKRFNEWLKFAVRVRDRQMAFARILRRFRRSQPIQLTLDDRRDSTGIAIRTISVHVLFRVILQLAEPLFPLARNNAILIAIFMWQSQRCRDRCELRRLEPKEQPYDFVGHLVILRPADAVQKNIAQHQASKNRGCERVSAP